MSHTTLKFAGDLAAYRALDAARTAEIAWTRVHAIINWCTCAIYILSDQSTLAVWKHQVHAIVIVTGIVIWEHRTAYLTPRGGSRALDLHLDNRRSNGWHWTRLTIKLNRIVQSWPFPHLKRIGRLRRIVEEPHDYGPIEPRSRRDRAAITLHLLWNRFHDWWSASYRGYGARSTPDRRSIVVRSWSTAAIIVAKMEQKSWPIRGKSWSYDVAPRNRSHDPCKPPPWWPPLPTFFGPNFLFKTMYFPLCSSTFDRFVKELCKFLGRSLVHRDPPAFRLDSEGIGAGLIANSSLISSNFLLEFWKSMRKDPSKFTPIRANWILILVEIGLVVRFDRLSRGNLSFY